MSVDTEQGGRERTPEEDAFDEKVQRCARIQDMAAHPGWLDFCDVVKEVLAAAQNKLAFGGCKDIEDYRSTAAEAKALGWVLRIPEAVQDRVNQERRVLDEDRLAAEADGG